MKEISLHLLDLGINSIEANAKNIKIEIVEDLSLDLIEIRIQDDGCGMESNLIESVTNPFFSTRITRKIGMGIPLTKETAIRCNGKFNIYSEKGKGTTIVFSFKNSHIDRPPLGNMGQTIITLINCNSNVDIKYEHLYNRVEFIFDTLEIKKSLGSVDIDDPQVLIWICEYINENVASIRKKG